MLKYISMENINDIIGQLNKEQTSPVLDTEGAVLVIAGAGSGKTRVLTSRIAYLILEKKVSPSEILAITFTNKAALEMKQRLEKIVGDVSDMWVSTIHSMCVKILRRDIDKIGYDKNFTIYDELDKDKVLKRVFEELGLEQDKFFKTAKNYISVAKNDNLSPEEFKKEYQILHFVDDIYQVYKRYEEHLERSNALDFDDLLVKTYKLFCDCPSVADYYSYKFRYIHIDEFQDTNKVQFAIAQRLSVVHGNIFVVGDDDQSIYGWRGAKIENILSFDDIYRGARVYKLERNYRSTKKIIQLANAIIENNVARRKKELYTENESGTGVQIIVASDENEEASTVALHIKNLMSRSEHKYKDFAVFMRVNALSRAFEQEFLKYGIPYKVFGGFRFFERKEIKDILAYLKVVNNTKDDESFLRSITCPRRGIGEKSLNELREYASLKNISIFEAIDYIDETSLSSSAKTKISNYKRLILSFIEYSKTEKPQNLLEKIIDDTSFLDQFAEKTEENLSKVYNVNELRNSAELFFKDNPTLGLAEYLNSITLSSDTDSINTDDAVTIATIHAVKGLEYRCVFVAGLDENILPGQRSKNDAEELEEERRLMYVAITRAKERLYLTRAYSRYMYGKRERMMPSRFLNEAKTVLTPEKKEVRQNESVLFNDNYSNIPQEDTNSGFGYSSSYAKNMINNSKPKENPKANYSGYRIGVKVRHVKFGVGTVIMVKGQGESIVVDVAFMGIGIKSLSVKYAPLEIIG